jgi:hypothetical protein
LRNAHDEHHEVESSQASQTAAAEAETAEKGQEKIVSNARVPVRRKPGRPVVHGARQALAQFRKGGRLNYLRGHVKERAAVAINLACALQGHRQWPAVEAALSDRSRPKVSRLKTALDVALAPLDAVQRERVLAAAEVGAVYRKLQTYAFRQHEWLQPDGELIPCLRKAFLAYSRDWRRELERFDLSEEDTTPSLQDYIEARSNRAPDGATAAQGDDHSGAGAPLSAGATEAGKAPCGGGCTDCRCGEPEIKKSNQLPDAIPGDTTQPEASAGGEDVA